MIDCLEKFDYFMIIEWEIFVIMDISLVIYVDSYRYVVWIKKICIYLKNCVNFLYVIVWF